MQAPIAPRLPLPFASAVPLLRPAYAVPVGGLPVFPPAWQIRPNARALVLRHDDGRVLCITTGDSTVDVRRVALISMGEQRLSIHADEKCCVAQWTAAGTTYRIVAQMSLAGFMDVLLSLLWG
jgi:hypothetical protein